MENLLMIFIGLVAVALLIIAAGIGAVAWYLVTLLRELGVITRRLHEAGEVVAEDMIRIRSQLSGGITQLIYKSATHLWPKKKTQQKSLPPQE